MFQRFKNFNFKTGGLLHCVGDGDGDGVKGLNSGFDF